MSGHDFNEIASQSIFVISSKKRHSRDEYSQQKHGANTEDDTYSQSLNPINRAKNKGNQTTSANDDSDFNSYKNVPLADHDQVSHDEGYQSLIVPAIPQKRNKIGTIIDEFDNNLAHKLYEDLPKQEN